MKRTSLVVAGFSAVLALGLIGYGCTSGDNVSGTGGSTGSGGTTSGQGGSTTTSSGGATGSSGGATGSSGGATGSSGGATGSQGGATGSQGGATGAAGSAGGLPLCPSPAPGDKTACDLTLSTTVTPCTKNCGVKASGAQKPCACITSTVVAGSPTSWDCSNQGACVYPTGFDGTCYKLTPAPAACPTPLPVSGTTACTNTAGATCGPLCGSATVGSYTTGTSTTAKIGYCACINSLWQCASVAEWPAQN